MIVKNHGFIGNTFVIILRMISLKIEICLFTPLLEKALSGAVGLDHFLYLDIVRRLVDVKVDRIFSS